MATSVACLVGASLIAACSSEIPPSALLMVQQLSDFRDEVIIVDLGGNSCTASAGTLLEVLGTHDGLVLVAVREVPEDSITYACTKNSEGFTSKDTAERLYERNMSYHREIERLRNAYAAIKDSRK